MLDIDLYEAMSTLRAVRRLRPDPIPDEVLHRVLQAAVWAPTGGNTQPWRVIAVKDVQKRQALQKLYQPAGNDSPSPTGKDLSPYLRASAKNKSEP